MDNSVLNGRKVTAKYRAYPDMQCDLIPDSNWLTLLGIDESFNEKAFRVHVRKCGLNPKHLKRVSGIGGYDKKQFNPRVDVECVSHQYVLEWVQALKMSTLKGKTLWACQRRSADFEDGESIPSWARKKNLSA